MCTLDIVHQDETVAETRKRSETTKRLPCTSAMNLSAFCCPRVRSNNDVKSGPITTGSFRIGSSVQTKKVNRGLEITK